MCLLKLAFVKGPTLAFSTPVLTFLDTDTYFIPLGKMFAIGVHVKTALTASLGYHQESSCRYL